MIVDHMVGGTYTLIGRRRFGYSEKLHGRVVLKV